MLWFIFLILLGTFCLFSGAELLVRGASQLALNLGIPPLVVGLTVVAFSTSMPEAVSSLMAQLSEGQGDIALGNVIGSNIANIGLVVGAAAVVRPIPVTTEVVWRESIVMLVITVAVIGLLALGPLSRMDGVLLLGGLALFIISQVRVAKSEKNIKPSMTHLTHKQVRSDIILVLGGSALLILGGYELVTGAVGMARIMSISERVIGLTIVALGTSLPELATSLVAAYRGETDISVGNVVGSNIFNLLFILGIVDVVKPIVFSPTLVSVDAMVMLGFSCALWLFIVRDRIVTRTEGLLFLAAYTVYIMTLRPA